jgi:HEAT repeat protein
MRAAEALGKLRAHKATDALLLTLRDEKPDVRRHALAALTRIADPGSADRLGDSLKDPDWRVRMGATLALSAIGDQKSLGYIEVATRDENEFVRKIAEAVLRKREGERPSK